jgi:hypothetical protein
MEKKKKKPSPPQIPNPTTNFTIIEWKSNIVEEHKFNVWWWRVFF